MRRLPLAALATALFLLGLVIPLAAAAPQSKVITVLPTTVLHLAGSQLYCSVNKGATIACFHLNKKLKRSGYAVVASERLVAVEPSGSTKPVFAKPIKPLQGSPVFSGGRGHGALPIDLHNGDVVAVGKTHMAVFVTAAKGGGSAVGIAYLDGRNNAIAGTYAVGISDRYVTVTQVLAAQKTKRVYRHTVDYLVK